MQAVRKWVVPLVIWLCLAGLAEAAESIGVVVGLQGTAQAVSEVGKERSLSVKSPVFAKDTIRTGPASKVQILFADDSLYSQGEHGEVILDRYVYDPAKKTENNCFIRFIRGVSRVITGRITDLHPEGFTVRTGRATIGIRGCELGFRVEDRFDQVYVVRLPSRRRIRISLGPEGGARGRVLELTEPGWVRIGDDDRLLRGVLSMEDVRGLSSSTTPSSDSGEEPHGASPGDGPGGTGAEGEGSAAPSDGSDDGDAPGDGGTAGDDGTTSGGTTEEASTLADQTVQDQEQGQNSLPGEPRPKPPPPPSPPLSPLAGGGLGGTYVNDGAGISLNRMFVYDRADAWFGPDRSWVTLRGGLFDRDGNLLNPVELSLRDVPLQVFGSTTVYDGSRRYPTEPGVFVQVDNLHQFVTRVNLNDPAQSLLWWGHPSSTYSPPPLPANRVLSYQVDSLFLPEVIDPGMAPAGVVQGELRLNTRTGAFVVRNPNGMADFGRIEDLQFYGQEMQGVSFLRNDAAFAQGTMLAGKAIAGHRDPAFNRPSPLTGWTWHGYAAGMLTPLYAAGMPAGISSADTSSDAPARNEHRVVISLDPQAYQANVNANINVYRNPVVSPVAEWRLGTPTESFYVDGNDFAAFYNQPQQHAALQNFRGGRDWTWGEWDGQQQVDLGGGNVGTEKTRGTFVAGRTLSQTEFQALVFGGVGYSLNTPADRMGEAVAYINRGNYQSEIHGTASLNVSIPGGGATPLWSGQFNMGGGSGGDRLSFSVSPTAVSPQGHLRGQPGSDYQLTAGGVNYNSGSLAPGSEMTGSLVGPGPGNPRPVTGAIGQGRFVHNDGTQVDMAYGTELQ